MPHEIEITTGAAHELRRIAPRERRRILAKIEGLRTDPRPAGVRKLPARDDLWRIRVGDYRVVYAVADETQRITITRVRNRRDVYR